MLYFASWKVALICAICALGVLLSLPNLFSPSLLAWVPRLLPHKQVALGLDLRGGSYLLLEVDVAAAQRERLNSLIDNVRNALRDANIGYTGLDVAGDAISFTIREPDRIDDARQAGPGGGARGRQGKGRGSSKGRNQRLTSFYRYETAWYALFRELESRSDLRYLRSRRIAVAAKSV